MRDCEHMKRHLSVVTHRDGELVSTQPVCDPFHTTRVIVGWSLWEAIKLLFSRNRETEICVAVSADGIATKRWFHGQDTCEKCRQIKIGPHPTYPNSDTGYHHGDERWCESCHYDYSPEEAVKAGAQHPKTKLHNGILALNGK